MNFFCLVRCVLRFSSISVPLMPLMFLFDNYDKGYSISVILAYLAVNFCFHQEAFDLKFFDNAKKFFFSFIKCNDV